MDQKSAVFVGVDVAAGAHGMSFASLLPDRRILASGSGRMEDILAYLTAQERVVVAINAPRGENGSRTRTALKKHLQSGETMAGYTQLSMDELLSAAFATSSVPAWMRRGFALYDLLREQDFFDYPNPEQPLIALETNAEAAFATLIHAPLLDTRLTEGRIQRQLLLDSLRVGVPEPMAYYEELTRHKLLHGSLPLQTICPAGELNALMCAYVAWLTVHRPAGLASTGDPAEPVYLPIPENE